MGGYCESWDVSSLGWLAAATVACMGACTTTYLGHRRTWDTNRLPLASTGSRLNVPREAV